MILLLTRCVLFALESETSDFYTDEELAAFAKAREEKKVRFVGGTTLLYSLADRTNVNNLGWFVQAKKKKKKLRKKEERVLHSLTAAAEDGDEKELGTRSDRERRREEKEAEQRKATRELYQSYQRATEKMAEESKALFGTRFSSPPLFVVC